MTKAILTGATGLIGKSLLDQLISCYLYKEIETWFRKLSGSVDQTFTEMVLAFNVVNIAKLAERSGMNCFLVISSICILRPSMLLGNREEKGFGEDVGKVLSKLVNPLLFGSLKKYQAIHAETVAAAMIQCALSPNPESMYWSRMKFRRWATR
ncbi:MAG: hypothetical protein HQ542_08645 [Bacteroidia bacterium]|nr:hypothetical protein [Bacteroidia bacterium]